jgi:hypothetical protein
MFCEKIAQWPQKWPKKSPNQFQSTKISPKSMGIFFLEKNCPMLKTFAQMAKIFPIWSHWLSTKDRTWLKEFRLWDRYDSVCLKFATMKHLFCQLKKLIHPFERYFMYWTSVGTMTSLNTCDDCFSSCIRSNSYICNSSNTTYVSVVVPGWINLLQKGSF